MAVSTGFRMRHFSKHVAIWCAPQARAQVAADASLREEQEQQKSGSRAPVEVDQVDL